MGDGHDGVWNLVKEFGKSEDFERWEILDWYHLKENLYKVGGSLKRLKAAEALLWQGQVDNTQALFLHYRGKQAKNFIANLVKTSLWYCQLCLLPGGTTLFYWFWSS